MAQQPGQVIEQPGKMDAALGAKVESFAKLREEINGEIWKRVEQAKTDPAMDVRGLCRDFENAGRHQLLEMLSLVSEIDFPLTAKSPPYEDAMIRGSAQDNRLTPPAKALVFYGKAGADACLEELKQSETVGIREYELWFVIEKSYHEEAMGMVKNKLGADSPVYQKLSEDVKAKRLPLAPLLK